MKIAIIGGAGFIGARLTKAYLDARHDVLVIDTLACGNQHTLDPRARFYQVDIRDGKLHTILQQERPDLVSHHAKQQDRSPVEMALADADVHVRGLLNVLDSCVSASVKKFIFASGGNSLYGNVDSEQLPLSEKTPLNPQSACDISKAAGEWYVRYYTQQFGLQHSILRYADVYGTSENPHALHPLTYFITMLLASRRPIIRGSGNEVRDHIFIDDVVQANLALLHRGVNRTFHISSGQGSSPNQLFQMVAQRMGSHIEPMYLSGPPIEAADVILDNTRAKLELNWSPEVSLLEGIRTMVTQLRGPRERPAVNNDTPAPGLALATEAKLMRV